MKLQKSDVSSKVDSKYERKTVLWNSVQKDLLLISKQNIIFYLYYLHISLPYFTNPLSYPLP